MIDEIKELFNELVERWELAEETVINDRGTLEDYNLLEEEEKMYRKKLENILLNLRA